MATTHPISITIGATLASSLGASVRGAEAQLGRLGQTMKALDARSSSMNRLADLRKQAVEAGKAWQESHAKVAALQSKRSAGEYSTKGLEAAQQRVAALEAKMADSASMSASKRLRIEQSLATARERLAAQQTKAEDRFSRELERTAAQAARAKERLTQAKAAVAELSAELSRAGVNTRNLSAEQTRLGSTMATLERRTESLTRARAAEQANHDKRMQLMGSMMSTVAVGMSLAAPAKEAVEFEAQMSRVGAVANATGKQLVQLTEEARKQGRDTKFSALEAAQGMEYLAMAGFNATQQVQAIGGVLNVAAAAGTDLGRTADLVSNALTGFGLSADQAGRVGDVLTKTFTSSNTTLESLGETLKYVAPVATQAGASLEFVSALTGVMGDAGIQGSMAGTALRSMFLRMIDPAKAGQKALDQMGISAEQMRDLIANGDLGGGAEQIKRMGVSIADEKGNLRDWMDILKELHAKMQNMTEQERLAAASAIAGKHAVSGFLAVLSSLDHDAGYIDAAVKNAIDSGASEEEVKQLRERLEKSTKLQERYHQNMLASQEGFAKKVATRMLDNTKGALTILGSAMSDLAISIGDVLSPAIRSSAESMTVLANKVSSFVQAFPVLSRVVLMGIGSLLTLSLATSALGFAWTVLKAPFLRMGTIFASIRAEQALLAASNAATGASTTLLGQQWTNLKGSMVGMVAGVRNAALAFWAMLPAIGATTAALLANPITWIVVGIGVAVAGAALLIRKYWDPIAAYLGGVWEGIKDGLGPALTTIGEALAPLAPVGQTIAAVFGVIADAVGAVVGWIGSLLEPVTLTKGEFNELSASGRSLGQTIGSVLGTALMVITTPIQAVGKAVGWLQEKFYALAAWEPVRTFEKAWQGVSGFFGELWANVTGLVGSAFDWIASKLKWNPLETIQAVWRDVSGFFGELWSGVTGVIGSAFDWIAAKIGWNPLDVIQAVWQPISGFFGEIWSGVTTTVGVAIDWIASKIGWNPIETIQAAWQPVAEFFTSLWDGIKAKIGADMDWIAAKIGWAAEMGKKLGSWFSSDEETKPQEQPKPGDVIQQSETPKEQPKPGDVVQKTEPPKEQPKPGDVIKQTVEAPKEQPKPGDVLQKTSQTKSSPSAPSAAPVAQAVPQQSSGGGRGPVSTNITAPISINAPGMNAQEIAAMIDTRLRELMREAQRSNSAALYD